MGKTDSLDHSQPFGTFREFCVVRLTRGHETTLLTVKGDIDVSSELENGGYRLHGLNHQNYIALSELGAKTQDLLLP
ncbi:hypothetical protein TNCV_3722331 [Trichonephila clavipes]|nr:hypothetical protein TNCV_3722331 [Trichonephila clavipes]